MSCARLGKAGPGSVALKSLCSFLLVQRPKGVHFFFFSADVSEQGKGQPRPLFQGTKPPRPRLHSTCGCCTEPSSLPLSDVSLG